MRVLGAHDLERLVALGQLGSDEFATLERERRALSRLRFGLHLVAGKREERLRFDHQKTLAARLGHVDNADNLAVEQMMQGFYRSAALVWRINDRLLQRFEEQLEGEATPEPLDAEFELRRGYLAAREPAMAARRCRPTSSRCSRPGRRTRASAACIRTPRARWPRHCRDLLSFERADAALRARFMALLRGPQPVETLAADGAAWRAWALAAGVLECFRAHAVRPVPCLHRRPAHAGGAEEHRRFCRGEADERFAMAHEVWPRLRKPELLLLAGLFHDIAKGRGGDHSELGAIDAREFCSAHGLSEADTGLVAWLVQKHLLMSVTAQKQDISRSRCHPSLRRAGRRPRTPRPAVPADLRRHRRHLAEVVEHVEGPAAGRPVHRDAAGVAPWPRTPGRGRRPHRRNPRRRARRARRLRCRQCRSRATVRCDAG